MPSPPLPFKRIVTGVPTVATSGSRTSSRSGVQVASPVTAGTLTASQACLVRMNRSQTPGVSAFAACNVARRHSR